MADFPELPTGPVIVTHLYDDRFDVADLTLCGGRWIGQPPGYSTTPRYLCPACSQAVRRG